MKILIAFLSRTNHTAELALLIAEDLAAKGHSVDLEEIAPAVEDDRWSLLWRSQLAWGPIWLTFFSNKYRDYLFENYRIPEVDILPLIHPDVSGYDRVCIGSPKQTIIPCGIHRYLREVEGLKGKKVGYFSTWAGPPLKRFETEHLFRPAGQRLERRGAKLVSILGLSSGFHEYHVMSVFRFFTRLRFGQSLDTYGVHTEYGRKNRKLFVDLLLRGDVDIMDSKGWRRSFEGRGIPLFASASPLSSLKPLRRWYGRREAGKGLPAPTRPGA